MKDLIRRIKSLQDIVFAPAIRQRPSVLRSTVKTPSAWESSEIESTLGIRLPEELRSFWNEAEELRLFEDIHDGHWGLILWGPAQTIARQDSTFVLARKDELQSGGIIIGEFLGDSDLVLIRCSPGESDFGVIRIVLRLYPRRDGCIQSWGHEAACHRVSKLWVRTAERMTNMRSAPGRDQRIPGPDRRALNCLIPLSTVPEPMG